MNIGNNEFWGWQMIVGMLATSQPIAISGRGTLYPRWGLTPGLSD